MDRTGVKVEQRKMRACGDYATVSADLISELGTTLVDACTVTVDEWVLDVAAGRGNAAIPATRTGARVVASDLTPELLATGRRRDAGPAWVAGDAEAPPFRDDRFDYGPMIETYRLAANDPDRGAALDCDLLDFLDGWFRGEATSTGVFSCEYVLLTARRSA